MNVSSRICKYGIFILALGCSSVTYSSKNNNTSIVPCQSSPPSIDLTQEKSTPSDFITIYYNEESKFYEIYDPVRNLKAKTYNVDSSECRDENLELKKVEDSIWRGLIMILLQKNMNLNITFDDFIKQICSFTQEVTLPPTNKKVIWIDYSRINMFLKCEKARLLSLDPSYEDKIK